MLVLGFACVLCCWFSGFGGCSLVPIRLRDSALVFSLLVVITAHGYDFCVKLGFGCRRWARVAGLGVYCGVLLWWVCWVCLLWVWVSWMHIVLLRIWLCVAIHGFVGLWVLMVGFVLGLLIVLYCFWSMVRVVI